MALRLIARGTDPRNRIPSIRVVRRLTDDEASWYTAACEHLNEFERSRDLLVLVETNQEEIRHALHALAESGRRDALEGTRTGHDSLRTVNGKIVNYLTATRLYLDHRRTQLDRRYGEPSPQLAAFDDARRRVYDCAPLYRFVYELRNYVQHCGMPVQVAQGRHEIVEGPGGEQVVHELFVGCSRSKLLTNYRKWKQARAFLEAQPEEFELYPLLESNTKLLWEIEDETLRAQVPELWRDAREVVYLLAQACDEQNTATVAEVTYSSDRTSIERVRFREPPLATLSALRLIEQMDAPPGWRVNTSVLAIPHPPRLV